jgi:putative endonuclease
LLWHLRLRGWRIVARDWRCPSGEIDILPAAAGCSRSSRSNARRTAVAASALAPRQRRRIVRAAQAFLTHRTDLAELDLRFDVMLVAPRHLPRHWRGAWRVDD